MGLQHTVWVRLAAMVPALALLAACGRGDEQARAQREARQHARAVTQRMAGEQGAANTLADDMVSAVSGADSSTPVSLKFRLATRPQVGQPLQLQLALAQAANLQIDALHLALQPREGLLLQSDRTLDIATPAVGAIQDISVQVLPQQAGVLGLTVTVLVDSAANSITRTFSIPLIAVEAAQ